MYLILYQVTKAYHDSTNREHHSKEIFKNFSRLFEIIKKVYEQRNRGHFHPRKIILYSFITTIK